MKIVHFYEDEATYLYDIEKDIIERNDLASQKPDVAVDMKEKLFAYLEEVDALLPVKNPSYDPNNPPSVGKTKGGGKDKKMRGGTKGKGKGQGKKGGKRKLPKSE